MNAFDAVVLLLLLVAVAMGYKSGLLRSVATIFGYLCAMPVAVVLTPRLAGLGERAHVVFPNWLLLTVLFFGIGVLLSAMLRIAVSEITGPEVTPLDRVAGALLGAVRIALIAVMIVVVFDRIIPYGRQPGFLVGSRLRPILSQAGQMGLKSLPPDVEATIDRLKRQRGI